MIKASNSALFAAYFPEFRLYGQDKKRLSEGLKTVDRIANG
jgi:hypothetical protein